MNCYFYALHVLLFFSYVVFVGWLAVCCYYFFFFSVRKGHALEIKSKKIDENDRP